MNENLASHTKFNLLSHNFGVFERKILRTSRINWQTVLRKNCDSIDCKMMDIMRP